jgi:hypothetical protein
LVPNSPEVTAAQIAGPQATAQAAAALAQAAQQAASGQPHPGQPHPGKPGQPHPGQGKPGAPHAGEPGEPHAGEPGEPHDGAASPSGTPGSSRGGNETQNQRNPDGSLQLVPPVLGTDSRTPNAGPRDAEPGKHQFKEEPWFAKLPPDVRKAMRAKGQHRAPRGYEERLQRYFENID